MTVCFLKLCNIATILTATEAKTIYTTTLCQDVQTGGCSTQLLFISYKGVWGDMQFWRLCESKCKTCVFHSDVRFLRSIFGVKNWSYYSWRCSSPIQFGFVWRALTPGLFSDPTNEFEPGHLKFSYINCDSIMFVTCSHACVTTLIPNIFSVLSYLLHLLVARYNSQEMQLRH